MYQFLIAVVPKKRSPLRVAALTLCAAMFSWSCGEVLGIVDAGLDPLLATTGSGGNGSTLCIEYCETVATSCLDEFVVYTSDDVCLGVCALLPEGDTDAKTGNSIQCRLSNAISAGATQEQNVHCPIAGPGGEGVCGENCESYCSLMSQACSLEFSDQFSSLSDCQMRCQTDIPDIGNYNTSIIEGDSIQCRLYHVSAATFHPGLHCAHAAGEVPCVPDGGAGEAVVSVSSAGGAGVGGSGGA